MKLNSLLTFITCFECFAPIVAEGETSMTRNTGSLRGDSRRLQRPILRSLEVVVSLDRFGQFFGDQFEDLISLAALPTWIVSLDGVDVGVTDSNGSFETQEDPPDFLLEGDTKLCVRIEDPEALSSADDSPLSVDSASDAAVSAILGRSPSDPSEAESGTVSANSVSDIAQSAGSGPLLSMSSGDVRRTLRVFTREPCYILQEQDFLFRVGGPVASIRFTITAEESTVEDPTIGEGERAVSTETSPPLFASLISAPTAAPSASSAPSSIPSDAPSEIPSSLPSISSQPSAMPSDRPSSLPSLSSVPSDVPSSSPTSSPSVSVSPSSAPSVSMLPSDIPSSVPSTKPSVSEKPSNSPSSIPTVQSSKAPSSAPSTPSRLSDAPSIVPSSIPTVQLSSVTSSPTLVAVEQFSVVQIAQRFIGGGGLN